MDQFYTQSGIARISGLSQSTLARRIRKHGIVSDGELVVISGLDEIRSPLFRRERLSEIVGAVRPVVAKPLPAEPEAGQ